MKMIKRVLNVSLVLLTLIPSFAGVPQKTIDLVQDALDNIQKTINEKRPYRIYRTYEVSGNSVTSITEKVHYKEYRKKPSLKKETFPSKKNSNNQSTKTIKFVFNSNNKNQITKISTTNNKNKQVDKIQCSL